MRNIVLYILASFSSLLVLFYCLTLTSISRGAGESFAVFLLPLSTHFSWDRASVASIYSVYMVCLGLGSLLSGLSFDKFGPLKGAKLIKCLRIIFFNGPLKGSLKKYYERRSRHQKPRLRGKG